MTRSEGESEAGLVWAAVQRTKDDDEDDVDGSSGLQRWGRKTMRGEQTGTKRCDCVFLAQDREEMDEEDPRQANSQDRHGKCSTNG
jgi:hypothetical protein